MKQGKVNKQSKNDKQKQIESLDAPLKRGFDKVYQMILANGLFILMNLHILLVFIFIEPGNIVIFYLILAMLSFNVFPSYMALIETLKQPAREEQKVMKDYFSFYVKNFKRSFVIGVIGLFVMVNLLTLSIFFLAQEREGLVRVFQGLFFLVFTTTLAVVYVGGTLKLSIGKTMKVGFKNLAYLLPGAAASMVIGALALYAGGLFRMLLIIGFSLGAVAQIKLSNNTIQKIIKGLTSNGGWKKNG